MPSAIRMIARYVSAMLMAGICTALPAQDLVNGLGGTAGFGEGTLDIGDDNVSVQVDITSVFPGGFNFYGRTYTKVWVNNNGNITFDARNFGFTPQQITGASARIIAPFYADVDTRGRDGLTATTGGTSTGANRVYYDLDAAAGIFTVTWDDVGYFASQTNKLNAFQLRLKRRSGGGFVIEFRYEAVNWTTGGADGGTNGLGGTIVRAGWSGGDGIHFSEVPGSGDQAAMLALPTTYVDRSITYNVNADGTIGDNRAPVAVDGSINVRQGTARRFTLNAYDPDGDDLVYKYENPADATKLLVFPASPTTFATTGGGTVRVADRTVVPPILEYTPPGTAVPFTDTFKFGATDVFNRDSNHATFTFRVAANVAPVAVASTVTVYANEVNLVTLLGTDANDDAPLTFTPVASPTAHGTYTGSAPSLRYTPTTGFIGTDTINFTVNDGLLTSGTATLTLKVIERPSIVITSPNGGEVIARNAPMTITWTLTGTLSTISFHYSTDGGQTWQVLASNLPNTGSATVTSPDVDSRQVRISAVDQPGTPMDQSDASFTVGNPDQGDDGKSCGIGSGSGLILGLLTLAGLYFRRHQRRP